MQFLKLWAPNNKKSNLGKNQQEKKLKRCDTKQFQRV